MKVILVGALALISLWTLNAHALHAVSPVLISQLQTGDMISASHEAVEIFNNTGYDINITDWCIRYSSATSPSPATNPKYCFLPVDAATKIYIEPEGYATVITSGYMLPGPQIPDGVFSGSGMAHAGGHIKILSSNGDVVDVLGWGTAIYGEGFIAGINSAPSSPSTTQSLVRKSISPLLLQDTDNNQDDFILQTPNMRTGGVYELRTIEDVCGNLDGIQESLPLEYGYDDAGNCELVTDDKCLNIDLIQTTVPENYESDLAQECYLDYCNNIEGIQLEVPTGYREDEYTCTHLETRELRLNEILPNVTGSDIGREFIEIYNPHSENINLHGYLLQIGTNFEKSYLLSSSFETIIPALNYAVFYNEQLDFSLLNTASKLRLLAPSGNIVSETSYSAPKEDMSWAMINGQWMYTDQLTPQGDNLPPLVEQPDIDSDISGNSLPCAAGKYRHPITNRCRNIESDATMLLACDADEYRNPDTNRCRKIIGLSSPLIPCNVGYERNAVTNRCRKVAGTSTELKPCARGYERNPASNRCRKGATTSVSEVIAKSPEVDTQGAILKNGFVLAAGFGVVGYGIYEWRNEIYKLIRRLLRLILGR